MGYPGRARRSSLEARSQARVGKAGVHTSIPRIPKMRKTKRQSATTFPSFGTAAMIERTSTRMPGMDRTAASGRRARSERRTLRLESSRWVRMGFPHAKHRRVKQSEQRTLRQARSSAASAGSKEKSGERRERRAQGAAGAESGERRERRAQGTAGAESGERRELVASPRA